MAQGYESPNMSQHRYESPNMSQAMEGMSRRKKMIVRIMTPLTGILRSCEMVSNRQLHGCPRVVEVSQVQGRLHLCHKVFL
jgi:hypothetical protein